MAQTIEVAWSVGSPAAAVQAWHCWQMDEELSSRLAPAPGKGVSPVWPPHCGPHVQAILERAFSCGLSRYQGWDLAAIPPLWQPEFRRAGQIFKRGVPIRGEEFGAQSGRYPIKLVITEPRATIIEAAATSFLVVDAGLAAAYPDLAAAAHILWKPAEAIKNLATVRQFCQAWQQHVGSGHPRPWLIVGGGVLADTAAFAAALCQTAFTLVPTTLLAAVDACVGGKTGVNFPPYGKNQLGLFAFPAAVWVFPLFFDQLSARLWRAGAVECLKHAFLAGNPELLTAVVKALRTGNRQLLTQHLPALIQVKATLVAADPCEQGVRALLNLGHTLGHALEGLAHEQPTESTAETLLHGEAVAWGLDFAFFLAQRNGLMTAEASRYCRQAIAAAGVRGQRTDLEAALGESLDTPGLWQRLSHYLRQDKKQTTAGSMINFVLLRAFGEPLPAPAGAASPYGYPIALAAVAASWRDYVAELEAIRSE